MILFKDFWVLVPRGAQLATFSLGLLSSVAIALLSTALFLIRIIMRLTTCRSAVWKSVNLLAFFNFGIAKFTHSFSANNSKGFTVFEERKVSGQLHGAEFAQVEALLGNTSMYAAMEAYGMDNVFSSLHPTLKGAAPDDSFSEVPYEKGF